MMLSIALSTTGCGSRYRDKALDEVNEIMDESFFYQVDYASKSNEEFYGPFYETYLNNFINYMSKSQYEEFINLVHEIEEMDNHDYEAIMAKLDTILCKEDSVGFGLYHAFNAELIYEELFPAWVCNDITFKHVNTLKSIINDDEAFFEALFSKDINKMVDLIAEKTCYEDKDKLKQMIKDFDSYCFNKENKETRDEYSAKIQCTMNLIVQSKLESDEEFALTFYGRMLKDSVYFNKNETNIIHPLLFQNPSLTLKSSDKGEVTFEFPDKYFLSSDIQLLELKYIVVNSKIKEAFELQSSDTMDLISFILSNDCTLENASNEEEIRCELYQDLSPYFSSSDDFVDFLLRLFNLTEYSQKRYFEILKARIQENGIDLYDFLRYQCLVSLYNEHELGHYFYKDGLDGLDKWEITQMPAEKAEKYAEFYRENYFLASVDCQKEFEDIESILANNNLGFELALNQSAKFAWWEKPVTIKDDFLVQVYSAPVEISTTTKDGITIKYFEAPNGFNQGYLVDVYKSLSGETITKQIHGLDTTIVDPETGEEKKIVVVSINDNCDVKGSLRFASSIELFRSNYKTQDDSIIKALTTSK